ncbi:bifunctional diguanylate cyclase/phosphodiesterase [Antrihabitans sp. YC2-6]|uniref:putative bifunctional diguanylate cyclase/phosphodiesterase n=1 Tax=Antrihabitans sp. YC2-6 TaxID=2799498 RepID=UPI0018F75059|nr:GGDEF domain-containing phosphodiesterase [Antrihabitans sp. YC2-6]MBJ8345521.1 EAL domain-containing protein [Antrihabitans sp. YC2-6]
MSIGRRNLPPLQWLQSPSALATPELMARATGGLYSTAGLFGIGITALMPFEAPNIPILYAIASTTACIGLVLMKWGGRFDLVHFEVAAFVGSLLLGGAVYWTPNDAVAQSMSVFAVIIAVNDGFFFAWHRVAVQLVFVALLIGAILAARPDLPWWISYSVATTTIAIGLTVGVLGRLASEADIDALTGLANRRGFHRSLNLAIGNATRAGLTPVVVLLDLDRFKAINDEHGHRAGDIVLRDVAKSWRAQLRSREVLARYGGDEFALLLPVASESAAVDATEALRRSISLGCSAGVASWRPGDTAASVLARADVALYRAKHAGRNRTIVESSQPSILAAELCDAIANSAIQVVYQPIVRLSAPVAVVGFEALVRFTSATQPDLSTPDVIRIAEDNDVIQELDRYVLRTACTELIGFAGAGIALHVNVSGLSLGARDYPATVSEAVESTGWPASQLVLEITETVLDAESESAIDNLSRLRRAGIRIAIDDFGTGYSSLSRLAKLPRDLVKLDGSFVAHLGPGAHSDPLLAGVASMCSALGLPIVAEGVETDHQAEVLTALRYPLAQGYLFGRPAPADALLRLIETVAAGSAGNTIVG